MLNGVILSVFFLLMLIFSGIILTSITSVILVPVSFTPWKVLKEIIEILNPKKGEMIADLGSGDGRVLIELAKKASINGIGVDVSPIMVLLSQARKLVSLNFKKDISFEVASMFDVDLKEYDKIFCNLSPKAMRVLHEKLKKELKGTVVYSYEHEIKSKKAINVHELSNGKKLFEYQY